MHHLRIILAAMFGISSSFTSSHAADPAPLPVEISAADPAIRYSGRFDMQEKTAPRCAWPASAITLKFSGTGINAKFTDDGHNWWQVEIDGQTTSRLELQRGTQTYPVATGLSEGEHIVTLTKATEGMIGITQFLGFQLSGGAKALPLPAVQRRIEIIGDSISCGYGVEAASPREHYSTHTENARIAYGALAAHTLGADYTCVAYSGRRMWPENTIPDIYDRTLPLNDTPKWDSAAWTPDVVLINLGTNDFGHTHPDEALWIEAYRKFIARIRLIYPKAMIYCATGTMLTDDAPWKPRSAVVECVKKIVDAERAAGDEKIQALDFGTQHPGDGIGADGHPGAKTQLLMAGKFVETLQHDLGWK